MKITTLLSTLLFSAAIAQDQVPLKEKAAGWFDKAKSYIPSGTPSIPNPVQAAGGAYAATKVQKINIRNYQRILRPKVSGEEEWLIYLTGGNKTCFGRCERADGAWNVSLETLLCYKQETNTVPKESVPILAALPQPAGAPTLHLGMIDCEKEQVLCSSMSVSAPAIMHFMFPILPYENATPQPASEFRYIDYNRTTVKSSDMIPMAVQAPNSKIYQLPVYEGWLHPIDGWMARFGVQQYFGYLIWGMGTTPSWLIMIVLSFVSRQMMTKKALNKTQPDIYGKPGQAAGQPAAAPAPPPANAAGRGTPGSAGKGGKKKR